MSVTAYAGDAFQPEIEGLGLEPGSLEEWDKERAETTVYV
jgi:hypothetical protein